MASDLDQLAYLGLPCPFCGVEPGEWCVTARPYARPPGRRTSWLHEARVRLLRQAWSIGWDQGEAMVYGSVAQRLAARLAGEHWARDMPTDPAALVAWLREREKRTRG